MTFLVNLPLLEKPFLKKNSQCKMLSISFKFHLVKFLPLENFYLLYSLLFIPLGFMSFVN